MPQPPSAAPACGLARCALRRDDRSPLEAGEICAGNASSVTLLRALAPRRSSCGSCAQEGLPASPCGSAVAHALPCASRSHREPGLPEADPAAATSDLSSPSAPGRAPCARGRASRGAREGGLSAGASASSGGDYGSVRLLLLLLSVLPSLAKGERRPGLSLQHRRALLPLPLLVLILTLLLLLLFFVFAFSFFNFSYRSLSLSALSYSMCSSPNPRSPSSLSSF